MPTTFKEILAKAAKTTINRQEALQLFQETEDDKKAEEMFRAASAVRDEVKGKTFKWSAGIASVLECNLKPHCLYCPYWVDPKDPLTIPEIVAAAQYIEAQGIREFHLSAGTTLGSDGQEMVEIVRSIRSDGKVRCAITINCGAALSQNAINELKKMGVISISSVFETANRKLFKQVKPGDDFNAKNQLAKMINNAGLEMGSGLLAGLGCRSCMKKCAVPMRGAPEIFGYEDYVKFIFKMKTYKNLTNLYVSRFLPYHGVPMDSHPRCSAMEGARIIAVMRLVLRTVDIRLANGWSREETPLWVAAGGGNNVLGVHINRSAEYKRQTGISQDNVENHHNVEYRNTMALTTKLLRELGISVVS
jgi:biotin synthase